MNRKVIDAELTYSEAVGRYQGLRDALEEMEQGGVSQVQLYVLRTMFEKATAARETAWAKFNEIADA